MAPPSLVSRMSMSVTHHVPSDSFITARPPLRTEREPQKQGSPSVILSDASSGWTALPADVPDGQTGDWMGETVTAKTADASGKKNLSYEEISRHNVEGDAWIVVDGNVYDVTQFLETHPGGPELILEHIRSEGVKDAGPLMRGKLDEDAHSHSKAAFRMLEQFFVGPVEASPGSLGLETSHVKNYRYDVDLTKPIVPQVGYLGADYDEWVHDPIVCKESPRFFENDILEFLTRTKWWIIPTVWCPVAFVMAYMGVVYENTPLAYVPILMAGGAGIWSFLEYMLHRFLFHMKTSSFWGNTLHYILHGFHHKHPMDGARLVFPPLLTAIICVGIWFFVGGWFVRYPWKLIMYSGGLLAYVTYDLTHYYLHFGNAFNDESRRMKRYHLNHHFKDQTNGYGITSNVWDMVFRTLPVNNERAEQVPRRCC